MSRIESSITLGPVGFELYGLLSIGQGLGVLVDRNVGGGSVRIEDVVGQREIDCFEEVAYGGGKSPAENTSLPLALASSTINQRVGNNILF